MIKCGFEFDPFSKHIGWRMGDSFSSLAFSVKKSGKRAAGSGHINLTLFQKRDKTEGKLGRDVKDVFERMDFFWGGGEVACSCWFSCCSTILKEC